MKKVAYAAVLAGAALMLLNASFAEESACSMCGQQMAGQGQAMGQGQMMGHGMRSGTMPGMMNEEMVAVNDGVIVLLGNKLYKYDKDLNLKKEVEIKAEAKEKPRQ